MSNSPLLSRLGVVLANAGDAKDGAPMPTAMPTLRDLGEADAILNQFLEETEGEETPEIAGLAEWLAGARTEHFERWGLWIRNAKGQAKLARAKAAFYADEAAAIMARAKTIESAIARSEARLLYEMVTRNMPKVDSPLVRIVRSFNPAHVVGDETVTTEAMESLFDNEETRQFVRFSPAAFELDKNVIKAALSNGQTLPALLSGVSTAQTEKVVVK